MLYVRVVSTALFDSLALDMGNVIESPWFMDCPPEAICCYRPYGNGGLS